MSPLARLYFLALGRLVVSRWWNALYRGLYRVAPNGVYHRLGGLPIMILTTVGRKTGERWATPLLGWREGQTVIVVASNAGRNWHPNWYRNILTQPEVELNERGRVTQMRAHVATEQERESLWPMLVRNYAGYEAYRSATARRIPVVVLDPGSP